MTFIVWILTFLLIINCAALVLLILVQLPKKDAGAGLAFGGGAADALFGAGSGNALTKITKWATVGFIVLAVLLGCLEIKVTTGSQSLIEQGIEQQQQMQPPAAAPQGTPPASSPVGAPAATPTPSLPLTPTPTTPSPATTTNK
jgi:protein translocase SecG subunit